VQHGNSAQLTRCEWAFALVKKNFKNRFCRKQKTKSVVRRVTWYLRGDVKLHRFFRWNRKTLKSKVIRVYHRKWKGKVHFLQRRTLFDEELLHIYLIFLDAYVLPPCGWHLPILEMRGKAQRVARSVQTRLQTSGSLTKVHQIFIRRRWVIGGVNARIYVATIPSVVECQLTE